MDFVAGKKHKDFDDWDLDASDAQLYGDMDYDF